MAKSIFSQEEVKILFGGRSGFGNDPHSGYIFIEKTGKIGSQKVIGDARISRAQGEIFFGAANDPGGKIPAPRRSIAKDRSKKIRLGSFVSSASCCESLGRTEKFPEGKP
jgi:hypothetical protein